MKTYVVRLGIRLGDPREWCGNAEDDIDAAVYATVKGPFPLDMGDLQVFDHDANQTVVTREQRLTRIRVLAPQHGVEL